MDLLIDLFLRRLFLNFFGKHARFLFFKAIGKPKTMAYLTAETSKDDYFFISQHMSNTLVGLLVIIGLSFGIAYIGFTYFNWGQ